jgi:protoporphyrinogen oxidase
MILGGGLSGLTLGYFLDKQREDFAILEKERQCGGLMRTLFENGFTFDYGGSHVIFSRNKEVLDFMLSLLGQNKIARRRNAKVLYKGRYMKYPFENDLSSLPKSINFRCLFTFIQNTIEKRSGTARKPKNLKEWFYYTFGEGIADEYLIPYNEKIWKYQSEKTSLAWVERIPSPPLEDVIRSSLGIETEGYLHQLNFHYTRHDGIQAIIDALTAPIDNKITTNFEIKKIRHERNQWLVSNGKQEKFCDSIVSTIPINDLIKATDAPAEVKKAAASLKYNSLISVMIGLDLKKINDLSWLYIPNPDVLPHRVSFPSNYSPYVAPPGKSSVLAEVTCPFHGEIWKTKDEELIDRVIDDLHTLKILRMQDICFSRVRKTQYAYVINDLNHDENMGIIREYLTEKDISSLGRFGEFAYLNMDDCVGRARAYSKGTSFLERT